MAPKLCSCDHNFQITPEMVEAGASELLNDFTAQNLSGGFVTAREVAEAVFLAMWEVRVKDLSTLPSHHRSV